MKNIDEINQELGEHTDWRVETDRIPFDETPVLALYRRIGSDWSEKQFVAHFPRDTPVHILLSCANVAKHYFALGQSSQIQDARYPLASASASGVSEATCELPVTKHVGVIDRIGYMPDGECGYYMFTLMDNPKEHFTMRPTSSTIALTRPGDSVRVDCIPVEDELFPCAIYFENYETGYNCWDRHHGYSPI